MTEKHMGISLFPLIFLFVAPSQVFGGELSPDQQLMLQRLNNGDYVYVTTNDPPDPNFNPMAVFGGTGVIETSSPGWLRALGKGLIGGGLVGLGGAIGSVVKVVGTGAGLAVGAGVAAGVITGLNSGCGSSLQEGEECRVQDVILYQFIEIPTIEEILQNIGPEDIEATGDLPDWTGGQTEVAFISALSLPVDVWGAEGDIVPTVDAQAFVLSAVVDEVTFSLFGVVISNSPEVTGRPLLMDDQLIIEFGELVDAIPTGTPSSFEATLLVTTLPEAAIPTVSEWGLIVMALLLLASGTIMLGGRRRVTMAG